MQLARLSLLLLRGAAGSSTTPAAFVRSMGLGINLGNVLDAPHEGDWAAPAEERYFDDFLSAGFESVRVPVRWDKHTMTAPPYTVDSSFLDRVEQVVGWSVARGLPTVVNTHHDDWLDGAFDDAEFSQQLERLVAIWAQVASRLQGYPERLLAFEVYNEPQKNMTTAWLNAMNAAVLPVLRATNPTRNVALGGLQWMSPKWILNHPDAMVIPPDDAHLFLEVHSYDPYNFCGMTGDTITHAWDKSDVDEWAAPLGEWAANRSMAVLLGEFGCNKTQSNATGRLEWYRYVRQTVRRRGFAATVWDDSGAFALYDRAAGAWDTSVLAALGLNASVRAANFADPSHLADRLPPLSWRPG